MKNMVFTIVLSLISLSGVSANADEHDFAQFLREKLTSSSPSCYGELGQPGKFWHRSAAEYSNNWKNRVLTVLANDLRASGVWNSDVTSYELSFKGADQTGLYYRVTAQFSRSPTGAKLVSTQVVPLFPQYDPTTGQEQEPTRGEFQITCEF